MQQVYYQFSLPTERKQQLEALGSKIGGTVALAELLDGAISAFVVKAGLGDTLPGWEIVPLVEGMSRFVHFAAPGLPILNLSADEAFAFAGMLDARCDVKQPAGATLELAEGDRVEIKRVGRGVRLTVNCPFKGVGMQATTRGIARDVARLLRGAAGQL